MTTQKPKRKILKRIAIGVGIVLIILVCAGYFILKYEIKNVLQYAVASSTNDAYKLDIDDVSFSLRDASIHLQNAALKNVVAKDTGANYNITIPELFIRLKGWKPLFKEKRLEVDSLFLNNAVVSINEGKFHRLTDTSKNFTLASIADDLNKALTKLEINKLDVTNTKIIYSFADAQKKQFVADKINFSIRNFGKTSGKEPRFLASDDIDLFIGGQSLQLPTNNSEIKFSSIHFSGKQQYFKIDSCSFKTFDSTDNSPIYFEAEELLFTASKLTSLYLESKLLIDTILCKRPVIHLKTKAKKNRSDSAHTSLAALNNIFDNIHFNYITVIEGQISLQQHKNEKESNYITQRTNLKLYDLDFSESNNNYFSLGNIELELDTIQFYTPDSLFVLNVDDFSIINNDLICKNASFLPAKKVTNSSGNMHLTLPKFTLENIDITQLLQKRLKAEYALFEEPDINVQGSGKKQGTDSTKKITGIDGLYHALNGFNELIYVNTMFVQNGDLHYTIHNKTNVSVVVNDLSAAIKLNQLFSSDSLIDIKRSLSNLSFNKVQFNNSKASATLEKISIQGELQRNHINKANIKLASGIKLAAYGITWAKLDWDKLYNTGKIYADSVQLKNLSLQYVQKKQLAKLKPKKNIQLTVNNFGIDNLDASVKLLNGTDVTTKANSINISSLINNNGLQWQDIFAKFQNAAYTKDATSIKVESAILDKQNGSILSNVNVALANGKISLPEVKLHTTLSNTNLQNLSLEYLIINNPILNIHAEKREPNNEKPFNLPFNINTGVFELNNASITYKSLPEDSIEVTSNASIIIDTLAIEKDSKEPVKYKDLRLNINNATAATKKIQATIPFFEMHLNNSMFSKNDKGKIDITTNAILQWKSIGLLLKNTNQNVLNISNISGKLDYENFQTNKKITKNNLPDILKDLQLNNASVKYVTKTNSLSIDNIAWNGADENLIVEGLNLKPQISRDTFFSTSQWQKDYMNIGVEKISINKIDIAKYLKDTAISIKEIIVQKPILETSRDKNIPFQHGIEKQMPTKLIEKIKIPLHINAVIIKDAAITANEISATTKREGTIPLASINAEIKNITNRPLENDSLYVRANATLLDHYIRNLQYKESYTDSLSGFRMSLKMSSMNLTSLNKITYPLAAVNIDKGMSDTLYEKIAGNKYAAYGKIKFYYKDLNVRMLDKKDSSHKKFMLSVGNFIANKFIIKTKNKRDAIIFFVRDPERFVFNYWIKSTFSGVMTSAGVKRSKKYEKKYKSIKKKYSLPTVESDD